MTYTSPSEWIDRLRQLWDEGHSTAEIGRRMGVTKNTIVGKAYRLGLPKREKPKGLRNLPKRVGRPAQTETSPTSPRQTTAAHDRNAAKVKITARPVKPAPRPIKIPETPPPPKYRGVISCLWPIGHPGTRDYRSCDTPSEAGKPYCEAHVKAAYVPTPRMDRRIGPT